jgi:hypothetical protein
MAGAKSHSTSRKQTAKIWLNQYIITVKNRRTFTLMLVIFAAQDKINRQKLVLPRWKRILLL